MNTNSTSFTLAGEGHKPVRLIELLTEEEEAAAKRVAALEAEEAKLLVKLECLKEAQADAVEHAVSDATDGLQILTEAKATLRAEISKLTATRDDLVVQITKLAGIVKSITAAMERGEG